MHKLEKNFRYVVCETMKYLYKAFRIAETDCTFYVNSEIYDKIVDMFKPDVPVTDRLFGMKILKYRATSAGRYISGFDIHCESKLGVTVTIPWVHVEKLDENQEIKT